MQEMKKDNNMCKTNFITAKQKYLIVLQIPYIGVTSFSLWRQLTTLWEFNFFLVSKVKPITKFLIYTRNRQNRPKRMTHWVCLCVPIYCRLWDPTASAIMTNQTKTTREVSNSPFYHSDMKLNVSTHLPHVRVKEATCMPRLSRSFC